MLRRQFFILPLTLLLFISFFFNVGSVTGQEPVGASTVASVQGAPIGFSETSNYVRLNFTMFIVDFYKSGYETIYAKNGSILVYYHSMVLQYWNDKVKDWRQAGVFSLLSWSREDDYHYQMVKRYEDSSTSPKTNYTITYDVRSDSRVKISIRIESGASRQYRLVWSFDGIVYSDWMEKKNIDNVKCQLLFGDEFKDYGFIKFDWQDIYEQFKTDISSYSVSTSAQGRKADIYFSIGTVAAGSVLTVDPSVVGTSTSSYATREPFQRKCFYANGRFWVFYSDGTNMVYSTSTDGSTWTSATTVRAAAAGYTFSVWFDGTYLHYAYAAASSIYYRRGAPNSDGTITWSAAEQTVSTTYNKADYPMVSVDSNGYVWIGYRDYTGTYYYPYVIKSGNNNGTWGTTPTGFPYQLSTTSSDAWRVSIIPLTSGKMLAVYASYNGDTLKVRRWDGSTWGSEVATTSAVYFGQYHSAVAQGDDVHLTFLKQYPYNILYVKYTYSSNSLGSETTLQAGTTSSSAPVISINSSTNDLYVFWAGYPTANHIYYRKYTASTGTWETGVDWIAETETLTDNNRLTCFYQVGGNNIGLLYMTKTTSPYNVKFAFLNVNNSPPNAPTLNSPAANYRFNPSASVTFSWTFSDPDSGDSQSAYQLQIGDSGFTTIYVDTGKVTSTSTSTTVTLPSTVGVYYWRVKTWDSRNAEGAWSAGRAIIVDRIKVNSLTADDTRRDVGSTVTLSVQLVYEYDSGYITSGTFTLNGLTLSYSGSNGVWRATDSKSVVQDVTYNSVAGTEGTYGLTAVNLNSQSVTVIWDGLKLSQYILDLQNQLVTVQAAYAYDNQPIANANVTYAGLYALTNSTGWAVFDLSVLSSVDWNSVAYPVSEPTYGLTYKMQNQTVAFHKLQVQPFTIRGNNFIGNPVWDDVNRKLTFTTSGTCIIKTGDWGQPLRVEVDGAVYTNWTYNSASQEVSIFNLHSNVALIWQTQAGAPGGAPSGVSPAPAPASIPPAEIPTVIPSTAPSLVNIGIVLIVAVVAGAFIYSQTGKAKTLDEAWRKRSKASTKTVSWKSSGKKSVSWKRKSRFRTLEE